VVTPGVRHVIGAGLAGLSAAVRLAEAGERVALYEATGRAGGRCRSYLDPQLDRVIDNGNHLLLSGNHAALAYLETIGSAGRLSGPKSGRFHFIDLETRESWDLDLGDSRLPWWVFDESSRVPGTRPRDYLAAARLLWRPDGKSVGEAMACSGPVYERLIAPMLLACLNIAPRQGSAKLAAAVIWRTVAAGGRNCRPLVAQDGLSDAFVDPALRFLRDRGAGLHFGQGLRAIGVADGAVEALVFGGETVALGRRDSAVLAVPPDQAQRLVPGLEAPSDFRAIANLHFLVPPPADLPPITGVLNGLTQWIFAFPGRISVTVSDADSLLERPREALAQEVWAEVAGVAGLPSALPPWQVVRERRATFATLPEQETKRPGPRTAWRNLFLAGDWTATGLPPTIEGAVLSGAVAARLAAA
jgi:hydroxysqualene dehydroxylase